MIERHKTAIKRHDASAPIKCGLRDGILALPTTVFDFGCGHGQDLEFLTSQGFECTGWDPVFRPGSSLQTADIVNLGYVINVIEDPIERSDTLLRAWKLCRKVLIVAAQITVSGRGNNHVEFSDGVLTRRGTFQKFYTQVELREYIEKVLQTEATPATPGIFYVFKDETVLQAFLANRYRRSPSSPRRCRSDLRFEKHKELLEQLLATVERLGRLPEPDEFELAAEAADAFGSLKRAFTFVRRVSGNDSWEEIAEDRRRDLLVYLALARFRRRPPLGRLPMSLQRDMRAFFGSYTKACAEADVILFRSGEAVAIDTACRESKIGKLLPNALYIHRSALESLDPLLRVYEGCGRAFIGEVDGANIIKIHRFSGKLSYLAYHDFEDVPHPTLHRSVKISLRFQTVDVYDYARSVNPPILHRKDTFLESSHPLREKFARLSRQEEKHGLLDDASYIGTKEGWEQRLRDAGMKIKGHRLFKVNRESLE